MLNNKKNNSLLTIINADDFGLNSSVNKAIMDAFKLKLISTTTLITNMVGFEEACEIAVKNKLQGRIGIHLNLVEGKPLTNGMLMCKRFCNASGYFNRALEGKHFNFSSDESEAVLFELTAQIEMLEKRGIKPTHMDSHHHFHTSLAFIPIIIKLARMKGITAIRLNGNCFEQTIPTYKKVYKLLYNTILYGFGMAKTDYFCAIDDIERVCGVLKKGIIEVMVHPTYAENGTLIDAENNQPLYQQLDMFDNKSLMLSFSDLERPQKPKLLNIDKKLSL